jgi:hypothetical protein
MSTPTIQLEHNGKTYSGQIATVESTSLSYESHGIMTSFLHCKWDGGGIGVGGYCLDEPKDRGGKDYSRKGTAYGLDYLIRVLETVGVSSWEAITGKQIIVLFEGKGGWGSMAAGFAGLLNGKVFIPKEHAAEWLSTD